MNKKKLSETIRKVIKEELNENSTKRVKVSNLKRGDVLSPTNLEVIDVSSGARTQPGKLDVTLRNNKGKTITAIWGKNTEVSIKSSVEENYPQPQIIRR